jgi:hypothetical protein
VFQLKTETTVRLMHINVRTEKHGPNDVDAMDVEFAMEGQNTKVLALLHPALCEALYFNEEAEAGQDEAPGLDTSLPDLRFPKLAQSIAWDDEATGVDLTVVYGLGDATSNIVLESGKASTKRAEVKQGGSSLVLFKFSISGYPDGVVDKLRKKLKQEVSIMMVQPDRLRAEAVIDGTVGHPGLAVKKAADPNQGDLLAGDATDTFAEQHGGEQPAGDTDQADDDSAGPGAGSSDDAPFGEPQTGENWPFPQGDNADTASADAGGDAAEFEAGTKAALEKAGVAPRGRRGRKTSAAVE